MYEGVGHLPPGQRLLEHLATNLVKGRLDVRRGCVDRVAKGIRPKEELLQDVGNAQAASRGAQADNLQHGAAHSRAQVCDLVDDIAHRL